MGMELPRRIPQDDGRVSLRVVLGLSAALLGLGDLGCRERSSVTGQRFDAVRSASPARSSPSLYTLEALESLMEQVQQRLGNAASVLMLEITPERATLQVESATRPGYVVQYEWEAGALRGPIPVELRGTGALGENLFPLSSLKVEQIPELARAAVARVDREHGRVERIVIRRNLPADEAVGIRVYVDSPIRSSHVDADVRGKISESARVP